MLLRRSNGNFDFLGRSEDFRSEFRFFLVQVLYESFDEAFDGRWIVSKNGDYEGIVVYLYTLTVWYGVVPICVLIRNVNDLYV